VWESQGVEVTRPGYKGEERVGVWVHGEFIELEPNEQYGVSPPKPRRYFPKETVKRRMMIALSVVALMICCLVIVCVAVLTVRIFLQNRSNQADWSSIVGGVLNAVVIMILNKVYRYFAVKLNDWENHRTVTSYENNLIIKIFLFQFVNSYTSLYYIAFFKRHAHLWGDEVLKDKCSDGDSKESFGWGCPNQLQLQLLSLLGTSIVVGQAQEVLLPWLTQKLKLMWLSHNIKMNAQKIPKHEKQNQLSSFEGTIDDYSEMIIQYGYITLFAAAFPLAPLLALFNNVIEMHTDSFKWLTSYNKPFHRATDDIGIWYDILEVLGVVAVITNCLMIAFTFENLYDVSQSLFVVFVSIVILEHIVLFGKYLASRLIPDMPPAMRKQIAKQHYIRTELFKKFKQSSLKL